MLASLPGTAFRSTVAHYSRLFRFRSKVHAFLDIGKGLLAPRLPGRKFFLLSETMLWQSMEKPPLCQTARIDVEYPIHLTNIDEY